MNKLITLLSLVLTVSIYSQSTIKGKITNADGEPVPFATIVIDNKGTEAKNDGTYYIENITTGEVKIAVSAVGYKRNIKSITLTSGENNVDFVLESDAQLDEIELFGERNKRAEKLETLTRLPLKPNEQLQSISILSSKLIDQQNALTIRDATKNVAGVYTFATYGNTRESMSLRGYRGIPMLKNGVRVNSDFRGQGFLTDMVGVDNIQVLKGLSSISQGLGGDLGSAGGVINIVTKTPKFHSGGEVSFRTGSWGKVRPTFDFYGPLDENNTIAYRIDGAYDRGDSFRKHVNSERIYINPSLAFRPNETTTITLEMDYLNDSRTPDQGTINLGGYDTNDIYELPNDRFMGFDTDRYNTKNSSYAVRFDKEINDKLAVKAGYFVSNLEIYAETSYAFQGGGRSGLPVLGNTERYREYYASGREDKNSVLQLDFVGKDIQTGSIKHTFQVGVDYRTSVFNNIGYSTTYATSNPYTDVIDVTQPISNTLPQGTSVALNPSRNSGSETKSYGFTIQDKVTLTDWADVFLGLRYSSIERTKGNFIGRSISGAKRDDAINPLLGFNIKPIKNLIVFGSYASNSNPRTSFYTDINGNELGTERWDQLEAGIKSNWLDDALRFNVTFFATKSENLNLQAIDAAGTFLGYYLKGGEDTRTGVEIELVGRVLPNLEVIAGYSYLDAKYKDHNAYYFNSSPLNTPKHTANFWANYAFKNSLNGLSIGAGAYYLGERPHNVWSRKYTHNGVEPNVKPFDLKAYTTVNAQVAYRFNNHFTLRVFGNNIFNAIGYNAYRTVYLNRIDPANFGATLSYKF